MNRRPPGARYPGAYDVEDAVFSGRFSKHRRMPDGFSLPDQRAIVERLAAHFDRPVPTVERKRGRLSIDSHASPTKDRLVMGALAGPAMVCHEFAHLLAPRVTSAPWHGPEWQARYVECVRVILGDYHAERLRIAFDIFEGGKAINRSKARRR